MRWETEQRKKVIETVNSDKPSRPAWMDDGQYAIYMEMHRLSMMMLKALADRDPEHWKSMLLRFREISRRVTDTFFE